MMKTYLIALVFLIPSMVAYGQQMATTDDGRKVLLHPDGKWEFIQSAVAEEAANLKAIGEAGADEMERLADAIRDSADAKGIALGAYEQEENRPTSSVYIGGRRLLAGAKTVINSEDEDLVTSVTLAKDGDRTLIMFWQESGDNRMSFFNWNWTGTVYLFLENGETISLTDRNMHGQNKIPNGKIGKYDMKSDLYQRFSGHYLTMAECQKLKRSNLSQLAYRTTEEVRSTIRLNISENPDTLREQLLAIKR